jgi:flagellar biosynthesis protein FlhG
MICSLSSVPAALVSKTCCGAFGILWFVRITLKSKSEGIQVDVSHEKPEIWAVGGGKGGVGKSLVSTLLALDMAGRGNKTILIDVDLGGANLHTMMGIKTPPRTLNDLVLRKYETMDQICIQTGIQNLQMVCGASEILTLANPQYAQKHKIVQNIVSLRADCVILDLGAGTSYNVLDFFLIAHHPIVVLTPQPISIQNAYGFVRNTVYRKLSRMAAQQPSLQNVIKAAMDPKNDRQMRTIHDLFETISALHKLKIVTQLKAAIRNIKPWIITNMARDPRDSNAGRIIQLVSEKYLTIQARQLGAIRYDSTLDQMVTRMNAVSKLEADSPARINVQNIVNRLIEVN